MALGINYCGSISPNILILTKKHFHLTEIRAFHVHVEGNISWDLLSFGDIIAELDTTLGYEEDFFRVISLRIEDIS
jgi:hypothetical protein